MNRECEDERSCRGGGTLYVIVIHIYMCEKLRRTAPNDSDFLINKSALRKTKHQFR